MRIVDWTKGIALGWCMAAALLQGVRAAAHAAAPIIDNARVTVWDATAPTPQPAGDSIWISLAPRVGDAVFRPKAARGPAPASDRAIVIALKDHVMPPLENRSGYPNAFPRPAKARAIITDLK